MHSTFLTRPWIALAVLALGACTADAPLGGAEVSTVTMRFLTPATVRSLVVQVSGAGITPAVVVNVPVNADTVATASLTLPSGSARRFVVTAVDTAGVETHRADTTITLQPGANPALAMRLEPLPSTLGITVTFGGVRLIIPDTSTRTILGGLTESITAIAIRANGDTIPSDSIRWGSQSPAVATVSAGTVTGVRGGSTAVTASYAGAAARVEVIVIDPASTQIVEVYTGGPYGCVRRANLRVLCWGTLPSGQVLATPTEIAPGVQWISFSASFSMLCGVTLDREAYCWGNNRFGQLGTGEAPQNIAYATPQPVAGNLQWSEIATGIYATCGTTFPDRALHCWGGIGVGGAEGPIGTPATSAPAPVGGPALKDITAGSAIVCGTGVTDGLPYCLGDAGGIFLNGLTRITAPEAIARTFAVGQGAACSVTAGGNAYCFGRSSIGGAITGPPIAPTTPQRIGAAITWSRFFGGETLHYCGIATDGGGHCWGSNPSGQVGDGTTNFRAEPNRLPFTWLQLAPALGSFGWGNRDHTCGLTTAREVYCWGEGEWLQLGNGTRTSSLAPVRVPIPAF